MNPSDRDKLLEDAGKVLDRALVLVEKYAPPGSVEHRLAVLTTSTAILAAARAVVAAAAELAPPAPATSPAPPSPWTSP